MRSTTSSFYHKSASLALVGFGGEIAGRSYGQPARFSVETPLLNTEGGFLHGLLQFLDFRRRQFRTVDLDRQLV